MWLTFLSSAMEIADTSAVHQFSRLMTNNHQRSVWHHKKLSSKIVHNMKAEPWIGLFRVNVMEDTSICKTIGGLDTFILFVQTE